MEWLECNQIAPDVLDTIKRERVVGYELSVRPRLSFVSRTVLLTPSSRTSVATPHDSARTALARPALSARARHSH